MSDFSGQKNLIGILILLGVPSIIAMLLAVLMPVIGNGGLPVVLIFSAVILLILFCIYKSKKNKR